MMMFRCLINPRVGLTKNALQPLKCQESLMRLTSPTKCQQKPMIFRQMSMMPRHSRSTSTLITMSSGNKEEKKGDQSRIFSDWKRGLLTVGGSVASGLIIIQMLQSKAEPATTITAIDPQFQEKSWSELISLYVTFRLCTITPLVKYGPEFLDFLQRIGLGGLCDILVENTFFATFCGGEDVNGIVLTGKKLLQQDLGTIVDYAEEEVKFDFLSDMELQRKVIMERFTESIMAASNIAPGSFVALRMTTFCPHDVLKKLSDTVLEKKESIGESETILDQDLLSQGLLNELEVESIEKAINCVSQLVQIASQKQVHIMLDAETWETQPAIDQMFLHILRESNSQKEGETKSPSTRPTMFQTFQAYTNSCPERLQEAIRFSEANQCPLAIKLVRGAYVEAETKRSLESGKPSPIWQTKEETDRCYNDAILSFTERIRTNLTSSEPTNRGPTSIMLATHNEQSSKIGLQERASLAKEDRKNIFFAQLYGMGRELSQKIIQEAKASPSTKELEDMPDVYKYVPYGTLEVVMGYLARRASENLGMRSLAKHEYLAAGKEMRRRLIGWK